MKINWGTGLVIGMALFISFILYFVYRISTDTNLDHDLVTEGYYQKEMELQGDIYAQQNTAAMKQKIQGKQTPEGYTLVFPKKYSNTTKGMVHFYRPSNKQLDFEVPLKLVDGEQNIPDNNLIGGRWNIIIDWEYEGKAYKFTKEIMYQ